MKLDLLDQELSRWKELLGNAGQNLVELDGNITYQTLRSGRRFNGGSEAQVQPIRQIIDRMWNLYAQITDVIQKVQDHRDNPPPIWKREEWAKEMEAMLHQPTVDDAISDAEFLAGNLTAKPVPPKFTVGKALSEVLDSYERTKALIQKLEIRFQQILEATKKVSARLGGLGTLPGVDALQPLIVDAQNQAEGDPFGNWAPLFDAIHAKIAKIENEAASIRRLDDLMVAGATKLNSLQSLADSALKAHDECIGLFGDAAAVPRAETQDLSDWLATLKSKLGSTDSAAVSVGLSRWSAALDARIALIDSPDKQNRDRLSRVEEVRGRLAAARARAGSKMVPGSEIATQYQSIEAALTARPLDLPRAEAALVALEKLIRLQG